MFINKINGISNVGFKGYQHLKNNVGENVMKFNYAYDYDKEDCEVQFFKLSEDENYNYKVDETPIASVKLKPEGVDINLQNITNLDKDEAFAYKIVRKDKQTGNVIWEGADTGAKIYGGKYTFVTRKGTTPMVQGAAYLAMPDSFMPGAIYAGYNDTNTGEIIRKSDIQKNAENEVRTFSNLYGGSIAGLHAGIPYLKQHGYKILPTLPIANGATKDSHGYWNTNNMQLASKMGTTENFSSFMQDLYKNGMKYVYDGTFTSEGLEGIHFQYALRWAENNPQTYYWFRMSGMKNASIGLGVIPKNDENFRHRLVNAPYKYELQANGTYKEVPNPHYNEKRPTYVQIYDARLVSDELLKDDTKPFAKYDKQAENELSIKTHDDTVINYTFPIRDFKEYQERIRVINDLNKHHSKNIKLDSAEGAKLATHFSNYKTDKKTEGGFVAWDANTDMAKMNFGISGYDEKLLQALPEPAMREHEKKMMERGAFEVKDMIIQAGKYWTQKVKDVQLMYTAQTIGREKTVSGINKLIEEGKLPKEAQINETVLNNILNGYYMLSPKGTLDKNSVTVKALMQMPLDAIEFNENTTGVLSTSYFSNRATSEDTLGVSRFDLMKQDNPHIVEPYANVYNKMNGLFNNELKTFAEDIIKKINETSNEKLLDKDGNYTEYGEYVIELVGKDITKYAMLKSLAGDNFKTKILKDGQITYDYDNIKENTSLEALGIRAHNPQEEAELLEKKIQKGLKNLSSSDIDFVANYVTGRIKGTDTISFRLAEAITDRAGLGLDWRLDAAKDIMDQDAVRNEDNTFDDINNNVIKYWAKWVQAVKEINPNAYMVAEITDIEQLMKDTYGLDSIPWQEHINIGQRFKSVSDFMEKFYSETGITSEAGYSYFFTDLLKVFSPEFEQGQYISPEHDSFKGRMDELLNTRSIDYIRNLYSFIGNHDKPRTLHGLSIDMRLFHSKILNNCIDFSQEHDQRNDVIRVLSGAKTMADVPIELRLNVDNNNYFKTVSGRSVAMSKLIMDSIYEDLDKIASDADKKLIVDALVDLANGNYLGSGSTNKMTKLKIKELSTLDGAFGEILKMAEAHGLKLTEAEKKELIKQVTDKANSMNLDNYLVHGDYHWASLDPEIRQNNEKHGREILGSSFDVSKHSLYTVQLAKLLKDAFVETGKNSGAKDAIFAGLKDFAQKYDKDTINANIEEFKTAEDFNDAMRKNAYGAMDIRTAIIMAVKQAEFKSGKTIANKEQIINTVFKSATEPGVAKLAMIMEFLKGLCGNATMYAGDELGMSGYEEKAKNVYLQNRNALPWEQLNEQSMLSDYRRKIMETLNGTMADRSNPELHSLNDGTPYALDVVVNSKNRQDIYDRINEINGLLPKATAEQKAELEKESRELSKELAKVAYLRQSANGDMTVSLFNADGVEHSNRVDYFNKYGLDTEEKRKKFFDDNNIDSINPNNKYVPILPKSEMDMIMLGAGITIPVGTVFLNANARDKAKYIVQQVGDKLGIIKEGGGKIVMNGSTSKNGVMILKHVKNIVFKGSPNKKTFYNSQYNFVSNPYKAVEQPEAGQKLSVLAK